MTQYPTVKVMLGYALLGGLVGTMVTHLYSIIYLVFIMGETATFDPAIFAYGWAVGFIPALGIWLAVRKIGLKSPIDLATCFAIGCVCTFLLLLRC